MIKSYSIKNALKKRATLYKVHFPANNSEKESPLLRTTEPSQITSLEWLLSSRSLKKPFSVLHSRIVTVFRLTVTSVMNTWSATGFLANQYSDPGLVRTGTSLATLLLLCPFTEAGFSSAQPFSTLTSAFFSNRLSSVRDATGLGEAGSFVDEWGRVASAGVGLLSVLVRGAVAVRAAGLDAEGIADVSSSDLEVWWPLALDTEEDCCFDSFRAWNEVSKCLKSKIFLWGQQIDKSGI